MAKTCKDCKWWESAMHFLPYRTCLLLDGYDDDDPSKAMACGRADNLEIRTGPDFGCIHWEVKEDG